MRVYYYFEKNTSNTYFSSHVKLIFRISKNHRFSIFSYFRFCEYYGDLTNIEAYQYIFPCDFAARSNEVDIYGTGGDILRGMKNLMLKLPRLKRVELIDLQLDIADCKY